MVLIVVTQRAEDGGPVLSEGERLQHSAACRMVVAGEAKGAGTLFVTTEYVTRAAATRASAPAACPPRSTDVPLTTACGCGRARCATHRLVVWLNDDTAQASYALTYPSLNLFAVSSDPATFSSKCIYCQVRALSHSRVVRADACHRTHTVPMRGDSNTPQLAGDDDEEEPAEVLFVPDDEEQRTCALLYRW